ncbi:MAG: hypothetical protein WCT04_23560 [Planctomycetota bacterium]
MRALSVQLIMACLLIAGNLSAGQGGPPPMGPAPKAPDVNIQWFATLDSAKKEAARTGRPILLISGTPHCSGVSGIW